MFGTAKKTWTKSRKILIGFCRVASVQLDVKLDVAAVLRETTVVPQAVAVPIAIISRQKKATKPTEQTVN